MDDDFTLSRHAQHELAYDFLTKLKDEHDQTE